MTDRSLDERARAFAAELPEAWEDSATVPDDAPVDRLLGWILESCRLVAPKPLAAQVEDRR